MWNNIVEFVIFMRELTSCIYSQPESYLKTICECEIDLSLTETTIYIVWQCYAQYCAMPILNCRVGSHRRCVLNSQLVHDGFGREIEN